MMTSIISEEEQSLQGDSVPRSKKELLAARIQESQTFTNSRKAQQLLQYIVQKTLYDALDECTEQQIGIHVFGRPPGYNATEDSIVRSQVRLLRQRLDAFFEGEGASEVLRLEIPRGHYIAVFTQSAASRPKPPLDPTHAHAGANQYADMVAEAVTAEAKTTDARAYRYWLLLTLLLLSVAMGCFWLGYHLRGSEMGRVSSAPRLWGSFLGAKEAPLVIYSNAVFVGNGTDGLRYATGQERTSEPIMDHYTGIGEVASIYRLTRFFDLYGRAFTLKRSRLVTWDEARTRNIVFVGAPLENTSQRVLPSSNDFAFEKDGSAYNIVNQRPLSGEPTLMRHSDWPINHDYAIVSLRPGFEAGTCMLVFSGMTTIGTQAAVEFATSVNGANQLLPESLDSHSNSFEAVLAVSVDSGVPISTKIVAMHRSSN